MSDLYFYSGQRAEDPLYQNVVVSDKPELKGNRFGSVVR